MNDQLCNSVTAQLLNGYKQYEFGNNIGGKALFNTKRTEEFIEDLLFLCFPGYNNKIQLTWHNAEIDIRERVEKIRDELSCLLNDLSVEPDKISDSVNKFVQTIPIVRGTIMSDIAAIHDGDPAAKSFDETILTNPGLFAISVQRFAHELHCLGIRILPRKMTEYAHSATGIDIHPGAKIGSGFFIDHGTGVVIGETAVIGNHVKVYQGVTIGALSFPKLQTGEIDTQAKRHPTIENNVTIYANATILGGSTVISSDSIIGASAFVTKSVPAGSIVKFELSKQKTNDNHRNQVAYT